MIKFKCKDFLLKESEFEAKGIHSVDEMMKLVEVHAGNVQWTLKLSPGTIEKIRSSWRNRRVSRIRSLCACIFARCLIRESPLVFWSDAS